MICKTIAFSVLLLGASPFIHPDREIVCPNYLPGTDTRVPPGVIYRYSREQWRDNLMRCFCETVKPIEEMCTRAGHGKERCENRTARWVSENFPVLPAPGQGGQGNNGTRKKNFILNIQVSP
jgi:hypothetical protein